MAPELRLPLPAALLASLVLHALVALGWALRTSVALCAPPAASQPDSWAANSVEVGTVPGGSPERTGTGPTESPTSSEGVAATSSKAKPRAGMRSLANPRTSAAATSHSHASLGAVGLPPGVRHLAKAFARALPEGGHRDAAWSELPLGPAGRAKVSIFVNEQGHIEQAELDPAQQTPEPLRRMIERTLLLLKSGTFSLDQQRVSAGIQRISVEVTLSQEATAGDEADAPLLMAKEGHQAPEPMHPGYARFTLNSGRHLEAVLRLGQP